MKWRMLLMALTLILFQSFSTSAQNGQIQVFDGEVSADESVVYFDLFDMQQGDTLYISANSDTIDTYVILCDINCEEFFAENDDIDAGNYNSLLEYTFTASGDYSVAVLDCCDDTASGDFSLVLGLNAPEVLSGVGTPAGEPFAVRYGTPSTDASNQQPIAISTDTAVQEFYAIVSEDIPVSYFDLFGMRAGQTIYLYAESDDIDTQLILCDIDCEEGFAENDDIDVDGGNYNSALQYTFEADGDYSIAITDCCSETAEGIFRLLIGYNAPDVLNGTAFPTNDIIAIPYEPTFVDFNTIEDEPTTSSPLIEFIRNNSGQVQQLYGAVDVNNEFVYFDIFEAQANQTLYLYVESSNIDTYMAVCDINCEEIFAENDDIDADGGNFNSALEYTFPADGDYSIVITDCCSETATGDFRLLLGYNAPQVLTGNATPNGATIAVPYEPMRPIVNVDEAVRDENAVVTDCTGFELGERPILSGSMQTVETPNFVIHYTLEGVDATTQSFVDEVARFVEEVLEVQTQQLGWPAAPRDCGEGGDNRFDFYLQEVLNEDILGYAQPENIVKDNPTSPFVETWSAYSFLVIDNDFNGVRNPLSVMRATVSHEFHHAVQFGYDVGDAVQWVYEATASWMELKTSVDQDATRYAQSVLNEPDLCVGTLDSEEGIRVYGEWLLIDSLAQDFGDESIIRLWEYLADYEGMDAYYRFLSEQGMTPQEAARNYAIRILLMDNDFGQLINDTVWVEARIEGIGTYTPSTGGVQELGADYALIRRRGNYNFSINSNSLDLVFVGINSGTGRVDVFELGQSGTVDTTNYSNAYVIVLNTDQHDDPTNCRTTNWELTVSDPVGRGVARPLPIIFSAQNFNLAG